MAQVSAIMPVYNGRKTIHKAIKSLQAKTFSDLDIFVVDDGSTDGTFEVLQSMAEADPRDQAVPDTGEFGGLPRKSSRAE